MKMVDQLRQALLSLTLRAEMETTFRRTRALAAAIVRTKDLPAQVSGVMKLWEFHEKETSSWITAEDVAAGKSGRFDACDLRHWLALAERAGVAAVPAEVILELSEEEMSVASGSVKLDSPLFRGMFRALKKALPAEAVAAAEAEASEGRGPGGERPDPEAVEEKLYAALDELPDRMMVRSQRCGPSTLKALAGCGLAGDGEPEPVSFGPDLEVGPGWVRRGNRRRVDAGDPRFVQGSAEGPVGPTVFLARPWVEAARRAMGPDPHRHGSPFAGKGSWPAEWRVFVENGRVIGVSSYYAWCGSATPENARIALEVRDLAQRIIDAAAAIGAVPVYMDHLFALRGKPAERIAHLDFEKASCTLDFIETAEGILLLEGGPAYTEIGGGHPCGFCGAERPEGVAFRLLPGVILADPATWAPREGQPRVWSDEQKAGRLLTWREVERLAAEEPAQTTE